MDRETFIQQYAEHSGVTVEALMQWRVVIPAFLDWPACDFEGCEGWHVIPREFAEEVWPWQVERGIMDAQALEYII